MRSADTSLAKIHYEMSELLDKQVNAQKEFINFRAMLNVNNTLIHCVQPASSWPHNSLL